MNISGMDISMEGDRKMTPYFHRFAKQLSDWYSSGITPDLASQDTRFTLELQKQKLRSLGLNMQIQFKKTEVKNGGVGMITYGDSVFENSIIGGSKRIAANIRNSQEEIYSSEAEGSLSIVMQNPKHGIVPSPDTAMSCPNCGVPSTLGKLESGCDFCNTKFLMDELYPKVMHFFIEENSKALFDTKHLKKYVIGGTGFFLVLFIVSTLVKAFTGALNNTRLLFEVISGIIGSMIPGAIFGAIAWFIVNSIGSVKLMGKNARGGSKMMKSLIFCNKMHTIDPTFSTEYFRDKSMSLLKFMLYSTNPEELTVCRCAQPIPDKLREIVDITYKNSGVNQYSIRDGVCDVSLTFYTDSLHCRSGKVRRESDKIRMSLRKVIKKPTDLGFSVTAVTCPSCAASFDAAKVKVCPYCGGTYPLEENDWVVTDLRMG